MTTPVITLWQPWATFVIYGGKMIENRGWAPPKKIMGKVNGIHAGKTFEKDIIEGMRDDDDPFFKEALRKCESACGHPSEGPRGKIIGTAFLKGYLHQENGKNIYHRFGGKVFEIAPEKLPEKVLRWWDSHQYGWHYVNVRPLKKPIPAKGKQGIWNFDLPEDDQ